jgi:hypothetical protein
VPGIIGLLLISSHLDLLKQNQILPCLYIDAGMTRPLLLLYVDDIVLTASSASLLQQVITALQREFAMTDMGPLHHFLGITVTRSASGLFLSQRQYSQDILERAGMGECKPCSTPVDVHSKLSADGPPVADST